MLTRVNGYQETPEVTALTRIVHKHAPNFQTVPFVTPCLSRDNEPADFSSLRNKTVTLYPSFSRSLSTDAYVLKHML